MSCACNGQNPPPDEKRRGGLLARAAISRGAFVSNHGCVGTKNVEGGREKVGRLRAGESSARVAATSRQLEVRVAIKNVDLVLRRRSSGCLLPKTRRGLVTRVDGSL